MKFFIGLNSIEGIDNMLYVFDQFGISSITVLVGDASSDKILPKYKTKDIEKGILPSDITITTCINWSGIDINESFHAVAISLNSRIHHSFSVENLIQFFGRSRTETEENTFTLAIGSAPEIGYRERVVSIKERKKQLEELLKYVPENIEDLNDQKEVLKVLAKTESSLIYEDMKGKPAVNWLLEDLEKYQKQIVEDYKGKAEGLLKKLEERFKVQEIPFDDEFEIRPPEKSDSDKIKENYDTFIANLNNDYSNVKLANKF